LRNHIALTLLPFVTLVSRIHCTIQNKKAPRAAPSPAAAAVPVAAAAVAAVGTRATAHSQSASPQADVSSDVSSDVHDLRAAASTFFNGVLQQQLLDAQKLQRRDLTVEDIRTVLGVRIVYAKTRGDTSDCAAAQCLKAELEEVSARSAGARSDAAVLKRWRERVQVQTEPVVHHDNAVSLSDTTACRQFHSTSCV
jgi:hypothetical protein